MLGAGGMAETHIAAISKVRALQEIRVFSPTPGNREKFARRMCETYGLNVIAVGSAKEASQGADILCSCTNSPRPVVTAELLRPGMHITAIGGALMRKLPLAWTELFVSARLTRLSESMAGHTGTKHLSSPLEMKAFLMELQDTLPISPQTGK
ncbi:hypothetical protein HED49_19690 [Ochrobactrum daejeonense]|nr:hypothetical protein [Brucella daejeonensis]